MANKKRFWKGAGQVSAEMIASLLIFSGALAGLIFLIRPRMRKKKKIDLKIFDIINAHTNKRNIRIMSGITFFGTHNFFIPANLSLIFYFLFIRRKTWFSIRISSISLSSLALMFLLKHLFKRKRPANPLLNPSKTLSFPSGHAISSVTFYGLLIYIISKTVHRKSIKIPLIISLLIFIQLIGFSRVYLRMHYASDVAVGYIAGLLWLLISLEVLKKIEKYNKDENRTNLINKDIASLALAHNSPGGISSTTGYEYRAATQS